MSRNMDRRCATNVSISSSNARRMVNPSGNFMTPSYLHRTWFRKIISRIFSYSFHNHLHISTTSAQAKPVFNLHAQLLLMQIHSSKLTSAPVIPQNTQFLDWFPFYVHRFIGRSEEHTSELQSL